MRNNFVPTARGAWTETNLKRVTNVSEEWYNDVNYAYPLNTVDKPIVVKKLLKWAGANNIIGLGRWGEWQHMNSDVAVEGALNLASRLILKL